MIPFAFLAVLAISFVIFLSMRIFAAGCILPLPNSASPRLIARYAPMQRLLETSDYRFLASHPAFGKARARQVRTERRRVFRAYLHCLSRDFARICASIRLIMIESGVDRPDLAKTLLKNRALFTAALLAVQFHLALHALGWGTVDVRNMVASLNGMREQLDALIANGIELQPMPEVA